MFQIPGKYIFVWLRRLLSCLAFTWYSQTVLTISTCFYRFSSLLLWYSQDILLISRCHLRVMPPSGDATFGWCADWACQHMLKGSRLSTTGWCHLRGVACIVHATHPYFVYHSGQIYFCLVTISWWIFLALTLKFSQDCSINYTTIYLHWAVMEGLLQFFLWGKQNWVACIAHTTCPYLALLAYLHMLPICLKSEFWAFPRNVPNLV